MRAFTTSGTRVYLALLALVVVISGVVVWLTTDRLAGSAPAPVDSFDRPGEMLVDQATLMTLPTSGGAWASLLAVANEDLEAPDLSDQDDMNAARTLATALVYRRTGDALYGAKVGRQLELLPDQSFDDARVLSVGRQIAGYVLAADLVGYREPSFVAFVHGIRTLDVGGHDRWRTIAQTSEDTASNWGAWALTSRIAASIYVGDRADVAHAATVFRRFTGDPHAFRAWQPTSDFDPTWACDPTNWVGINPASCGDRGGAIVEDVSRSRKHYPTVDATGLMYSWESLGAAMLSAKLLSRAGYPDVYEWGDRALLRAAQFLQQKGGYPPRYGSNMHIAWAVNRVYSVDLGPVDDRASHGRQYGFTDWLP